jgi:hypothetical protein
VVKNYRVMFEHGIHPEGSYQDVFGYIPPDQDFNPEHPSTRTDSMNYRAAVLNWTKNNLGIVGTEPNLESVRRMAALHQRVGLLEMTSHEFLDKARRKERTTFADGTTVTVDWDAKTAEIKLELNLR